MIPATRHLARIGALLCAVSLTIADSAGFCTFYTEDYCEKRSGSVNYATDNNGILQNGGPYFKCDADEEISLISYPPGDSNGESPNHCYVFTKGYFSAGFGVCQDLRDLDFTPGDGGFYRISEDKTCPTLTKRETGGPSRRREVDLEKRSANYLTFYDDPDCSEQVGSKSYSSKNQGCFENTGPYAKFPGDDTDWHIEQWSGTDNFQCADTMTHCVDSSAFAFNINEDSGCRHLDDIGLMSGYGSYKIGRAGCP